MWKLLSKNFSIEKYEKIMPNVNIVNDYYHDHF